MTIAEPSTAALVTAHPMLPEIWRIANVRRDTSDTFTLQFNTAEHAGGFEFAPGQFNMLYAFGCGEVPISISGDPTKPNTLIHTIREVGPVTKALGALKRGDTIGVRGPYGTHWPVVESAGSDIVLVAGGIGLAPLRPALYQVLANRRDYGQVVLLYGTRTPADILFLKEVEEWRARFDLQVLVTVDRGDQDWLGTVGVVTRLIPLAQFDAGNAVAMVCGPEVMMRFTVNELVDRGMSKDQIYISMERNMKCGIGLCGHCQFGSSFICKDGPVFRYDAIGPLLPIREL
ncbi:MAG TPA: FAD/NAD(P)-binding protein [Bryobacteraceae bacterium]|nr:FAD/NAD(P)-binding protein [Bryobacteraceae bacterium]